MEVHNGSVRGPLSVSRMGSSGLARRWIVLYMAAAGAVGILVAIDAPGMAFNPSWAGAFLWLLLFGGLVRGLWIARRLLIAWNVALIVVLMAWWAPFDEWGIVAFEVLMGVQVIALCAQERALKAA
jgi:hypothetical protein